MRDLLLLLTYLAFLAVGTMAPFVLALGYVWVDVFSPQSLGWSPLSTLPVAFIMGAAAVGAYLVLDRRSPPRLSGMLILLLLLAVWITATTSWAARPDESFIKWDVAIKALLFAVFVPFVVRSRVQIEAFVHVYVFSLAAHVLPWAFKTLLSGGGYGFSLGLVGANALWLSESSAVAAIGIMLLPLLLSLRKHSVLLPRGRVRDLVYYGTALGGLFASVGTFARTAIVGFGVLGVTMLLRTKRKVSFMLISALVAGALFAVTSDKWTARISTIQDYETESSSLIRLLVWRWTIDYVVQNPFGGGFRVWLTNRISFPGPDGQDIVQYGRAFHSMVFAVLGEHGWPGLFLYGAIVVTAFLSLRAVIRQTAGHPTHEWASDLAKALQITIAVLLACGNFIDISFEPLVWYLFSMVICLREYVRRVMAPITGPVGLALPARIGPVTAAQPGAAVARTGVARTGADSRYPSRTRHVRVDPTA